MKIFFFILLILVSACSKKQKTIQPTIQSITEAVYASGKIKTQNQYKVFSTVSGIVQQVLVVENDVVNVGTPLFIIANEQQQLLEKNAQLNFNFNAVEFNNGKLNDAQSLINIAKEKMANDGLMLERQQNLWNQNIGTKVELEQKKLALSSAKTNYKSALQKYNDLSKQISFLATQAQNNLQLSNKTTNDFIVKSSVKGKVYQVNATKGELATPQVPLAILGDNNNYILEMQVDEYDIVSIKLGMKVMVVLNSYKDAVFKARVSKINPLMNTQSKTFIVEAEFIDQPALLYPDISFEANILIKSKTEALLIPRNCLLNDSTVLLISGKQRLVKTGLKDFQMIEIISGIDKKDALILPQK